MKIASTKISIILVEDLGLMVEISISGTTQGSNPFSIIFFSNGFSFNGFSFKKKLLLWATNQVNISLKKFN